MVFSKSIFQLLVIVVLFVVFAGYSFMQADWTAPPTTPPTNNVAAPINVGASVTSFQPGKGSLQFDFLSARDTLLAGVEILSPSVKADAIDVGALTADTITAETLNVNVAVTAGKIKTDFFCTADGSKCASLAELLADRNTTGGSLTQNGNVSWGSYRNTSGSQTHYTSSVTFPKPYKSPPGVTFTPSGCSMITDVTATGFSLRYTLSSGESCARPTTWTAVGTGI